jgi:hypothetical protein
LIAGHELEDDARQVASELGHGVLEDVERRRLGGSDAHDASLGGRVFELVAVEPIEAVGDTANELD